jgi:hypothetical protein
LYHWGKIYKKSFLKQIDLSIWNLLGMVHDCLFNNLVILMCSENKYEFINEPIVIYYLNLDSVSHSSNDKLSISTYSNLKWYLEKYNSNMWNTNKERYVYNSLVWNAMFCCWKSKNIHLLAALIKEFKIKKLFFIHERGMAHWNLKYAFFILITNIKLSYLSHFKN